MTAADNGSPVRSAVTGVNITLTDINNRLPRFSNDLYVQYMNESKLKTIFKVRGLGTLKIISNVQLSTP